MHTELSGEIIGAAGPGLLESIYEEALVVELQDREINVQRQIEVPIEYKGRRLGNALRLDLLVGGHIVVEVKSIERILPVHEAQLLGYLRMTGRRLGLLINFNSAVLSKSIRRIAN